MTPMVARVLCLTLPVAIGKSVDAKGIRGGPGPSPASGPPRPVDTDYYCDEAEAPGSPPREKAASPPPRNIPGLLTDLEQSPPSSVSKSVRTEGTTMTSSDRTDATRRTSGP